MHGQLYHGHTNATALSSSLVVSALSSESDNPGSSPAQGKALRPTFTPTFTSEQYVLQL